MDENTRRLVDFSENTPVNSNIDATIGLLR